MSSRRDFLRRSFGLGFPSDATAWAEVERRAAQFGIVPGTRVDASGALLTSPMTGEEPYLGEIFFFAFNFVPKYYAPCDGRLLPINQNQALYFLIGTTFGGNGSTNFALPDLRGRVPVHQGSGWLLGQQGGSESVTVSVGQLPPHTHAVTAAGAGTLVAPVEGSRFAPLEAGRAGYAASATSAWPTGSTGGTQPHNNMPPVLVLNACIALQGIYPSST